MQMKIKKTNLKTLLPKITKMDENSKKNQAIIQKRDCKLKSFIGRLEQETLLKTYKNALGIY